VREDREDVVTDVVNDVVNMDAWLSAAIADATARGLPELKPLLESFAQATAALRSADFRDDASGADGSTNGPELQPPVPKR
jgi:hypothetical protein